MLVRQALVASPGSRILKRNEVISRSENIDDELALALCQSSPGRNELGLGMQQSTNFFQPAPDTFALSRSVGGLERDRDGGRRIVSQIVLFDRDQLDGYNNNIALVAHVLQTSGLMILEDSRAETLPLLEVPEQAFGTLGEFSRAGYSAETERIAEAVDLHSRVVILGLQNPMSFLCSFLADLPPSGRLNSSFATGLKVLDRRPFSLQFIPDVELDVLDELANRQIRTISLESNPLALNG